MGCVCSTRPEIKIESFSIEIFLVEKTAKTGEFNFKRIFSKNYEIKLGLKVFDYLKSSTDLLNNYFKNGFYDTKEKNGSNKDSNLNIKRSLYIFYYTKQKIPKIKEHDYAKNFNPYNENALNEDNNIKKIKIILLYNLDSLGIDKKDFYGEIDKIIKYGIGEDYDFDGKSIIFNSEEVSEIKDDDLNDERIELELLQGIN